MTTNNDLVDDKLDQQLTRLEASMDRIETMLETIVARLREREAAAE